jgi:hypothetical protein
LNAGVLEDGSRRQQLTGSPQGAPISPLLANVYLHYAFDLWAERWRRKYARGDVVLVRYADDTVLGFQYKADALRFQAERHICRATEGTTGTGQAGDLRLPWIHAHLRVEQDRAVSRASTHSQIANARSAAIDPSRTDAPQASSAAGTGAVAPPGCAGLFRVPCRAQEWPTPHSVPGRSATRLDPRAASA